MIRFKKFLISAWISIDIRSLSGFLSYPIGLQIAEFTSFIRFSCNILIVWRTLLKRMSLELLPHTHKLPHFFASISLYLVLLLHQLSQFNNFDYFFHIAHCIRWRGEYARAISSLSYFLASTHFYPSKREREMAVCVCVCVRQCND